MVTASDAASPADPREPGRVDPSGHPLPPLRVKWKRPYYGLPELGWIIELAAYDVSANVVFLGGADFDSPPPLGTTDRTRYVKVTTIDEAQQPELRQWIEQAARTPGWA